MEHRPGSGPAGEPESGGDPVIRRVRGSRRAQRPAPRGVDPTPNDHALSARAAEDTPQGWGGAPANRPKESGENDSRLRADKPPHWG